jgi:hypothetical protein
MDERRATTGSRRLAIKRVQCFNEALCFVSSSLLADSFMLSHAICGENRHLRQVPSLCVMHFLKPTFTKKTAPISRGGSFKTIFLNEIRSS